MQQAALYLYYWFWSIDTAYCLTICFWLMLISIRINNIYFLKSELQYFIFPFQIF
jgi:hypothetical protein